jgi:hypothetical protein
MQWKFVITIQSVMIRVHIIVKNYEEIRLKGMPVSTK